MTPPLPCLKPRCFSWPSALASLTILASSPSLPANPSLPNLSGLHIALDIGHNLSSPGATSARGKSELYFNQATAQTIASVLRRAGAKVTLINEKGTTTGLAERPQLAATSGAHAFISIHHDSVNDRYLKTWEFEGKSLTYSDRFQGYSVFASRKNFLAAKSRALAIEIGSAMLQAGFNPTPHHNEAIPGENRPYIDERTGVYEFTDLVVAKAGKIPSVLLECGVIVHRDEELLVQTKEYQERIGAAIAHALASAREKDLLPKAPPAPKPNSQPTSPPPSGGILQGSPPSETSPANSGNPPSRKLLIPKLFPPSPKAP